MANGNPLLMLGLPKGSMEEPTIRLFAKAGWRISVSSRSYKPSFDDAELDGRFVRSQEVSRYVEHGYFDAGLCGHDWIVENRSDVVEVSKLTYSRASRRKARWVLAVPEDSAIRTVADLEGKRIATEVVHITRRFLEERGVSAHVEFSWGATEMKTPDLVDAIVDVTETGDSLRVNRLRVVETVLETDIRFIANPASWKEAAKRSKIEQIALMLGAALDAEGQVGMKLNVRRAQLETVLHALPALRNPTISTLSDADWVALETVIAESAVRELIPRLKEHGAEGIIEYPLNKVVY